MMHNGRRFRWKNLREERMFGREGKRKEERRKEERGREVKEGDGMDRPKGMNR